MVEAYLRDISSCLAFHFMVTYCRFISSSAGVGRSGTFITLDRILDLLDAEGENSLIDVEGVVRSMRNQRMLMVQVVVSDKFNHTQL